MFVPDYRTSLDGVGSLEGSRRHTNLVGPGVVPPDQVDDVLDRDLLVRAGTVAPVS